MMGPISAGMGLGSMVGSLFGGSDRRDPAAEARQYTQQIQPGLDRYLDPYISTGKQAMGTLQDQYQNLLNDPNQLMSRIGGGYQQSPGYQHNVDAATRASSNAAAAGGFIGSPQHQLQMAKEIGGLASQDYNQYLNNAMGLYGQGLQGMGGLNQLGYGASQQGASTLSDMLNKQAEMAYANAMNENQLNTQSGGMFGSLAGGALGALSSFL